MNFIEEYQPESSSDVFAKDASQPISPKQGKEKPEGGDYISEEEKRLRRLIRNREAARRYSSI